MIICGQIDEYLYILMEIRTFYELFSERKNKKFILKEWNAHLMECYLLLLKHSVLINFTLLKPNGTEIDIFLLC